MGTWWSDFVRDWAEPKFPIVVMQSVVWAGMAAVWFVLTLGDPSAWRVGLAALFTALAVFWISGLVGSVRLRRARRGV